MTDSSADGRAIVGQLADPDRRRVLAAVELGARTLAEAIASAGLPEHRVTRALAKLVDGGLIVVGPDGFAVDDSVFRTAARDLLSRPASTEHDHQPADVRKVLDHFVRGGHIGELPTARAKRRVVLDWLAQRFEPGPRYTERQVNELLREHSDDTATLRRYLVDEGFLERADGRYWRAGGTVDVSAAD